MNGKAQETTLDTDDTLMVKGMICVPRFDALIQKLLAVSWFDVFYSSECDQDVYG